MMRMFFVKIGDGMMQEHLFERMARERGITVEEMRAIISERIEKGWNDSD